MSFRFARMQSARHQCRCSAQQTSSCLQARMSWEHPRKSQSQRKRRPLQPSKLVMKPLRPTTLSSRSDINTSPINTQPSQHLALSTLLSSRLPRPTRAPPFADQRQSRPVAEQSQSQSRRWRQAAPRAAALDHPSLPPKRAGTTCARASTPAEKCATRLRSRDRKRGGR